MKKWIIPENYVVFHDYEGTNYAVDEENMNLMDKEFIRYQSYLNIPDDKTVECFPIDHDIKTDTCSINLKRTCTIKMNLLSPKTFYTIYKL